VSPSNRRSCISHRHRDRHVDAATHGKRVQALGGAKNHAVVLPDADLDLAADALVNADVGSAGERCMAISVAYAVGDIADDGPMRDERLSSGDHGDVLAGCERDGLNGLDIARRAGALGLAVSARTSR
jgi:hypothetical protein